MSSPTIQDTYHHFSIIKSKLGIDGKSLKNLNNYFYLFLILYPLITIFFLIYFKPDCVCTKDIKDIQRRPRKKISYTKLLSIFILFQFPLVLYLILR